MKTSLSQASYGFPQTCPRRGGAALRTNTSTGTSTNTNCNSNGNSNSSSNSTTNTNTNTRRLLHPLWESAGFGWHYLSNATCLIRPHLFCVFFVVSRIVIICYIICHL